MRTAVVLLGVAWVAVATPASAQARRWEDLSPAQQERAFKNYERYRNLPEQKREHVERRMLEWQSMSPEQQDRLRRNNDAYEGMDPSKRQRLDEAYRRRMERGRGGDR